MKDKDAESHCIQQVQRWVNDTVVGLNFCPFARRSIDNKALRYVVESGGKKKVVLTALLDECELLQAKPEIDTSIVILTKGFLGFHQYLELLDMANDLLHMEGYVGVFQLASFHPDYCFEGVDVDDASNFTNRSPYPLLHILREEQLEAALASYSNPEEIPQRNINVARDKGVLYMQSLLDIAKNS